MRGSLVKLFLGAFIALAAGKEGLAKPVFVGTSRGYPSSIERTAMLGLSYMTAEQMAEKIVSLTGFFQPGFLEFGSVIGRFDPRTGVRTNDRPTVMSVMIMSELVNEVAQSVLAREVFLDEQDRVVLKGLDLDRSPDDATLTGFVSATCANWLQQTCPVEMERTMVEDFRTAESGADGLANAWTGLIASMLQNGTIYFY